MSTEPRDMLGPTVTVTPAGQTTAPAGEDVYQAAAEEWCRSRFSYFGPYATDASRDRHIAYDARDTAREPAWRAAVDEAVRLTEQRVRAEYAEELAAANSVMEMADGALDQMAANLAKTEENQAAINERLRALTGDIRRIVAERDAAHADAAQLRAAAGPATGWASAADLQAAYTDLLRRLEVTEVDIATLTDQVRRAEAERDEIEAQGLAKVDDLNGRLHRAERERAALAQRARVVDITQLNEAGTRTLCNTCGHEQFTPARPLYATESGEQASVVPPDPNGPEGGSGGAA